MSTSNERERARQLIMAAIDAELRNEDRKELSVYLNKYPELKQEFNEFKELQEITMQTKFNPLPEQVWDNYWLQVYNRLERGIGWILFSLGAIVLLFYGLYSMIESILVDVEIDWWVKLAIFSALAGVIILLISVIREKLFLHKSERYKDIRQ